MCQIQHVFPLCEPGGHRLSWGILRTLVAGQCDGGPQDIGVAHGTLSGALHALSALASDAKGKIVMNGTFSLVHLSWYLIC